MILSKDLPRFALVSSEGHLIGMSDAADDILDLHFQHLGSHLGKTADMAWTMPLPSSHPRSYSEAEAAVRAALLPYVTPTPREVQQLTTHFLNRPNQFYYENRKIPAIKETRAMFSLGLAEAKAVVDATWAAYDSLARDGKLPL